jgi:hypothetical protein
MRFGSHSHDIDREKIDATVTAERARIVASLRDLADRLERAPAKRANEVLVWIRSALEPLLTMLGRLLGAK